MGRSKVPSHFERLGHDAYHDLFMAIIVDHCFLNTFPSYG